MAKDDQDLPKPGLRTLGVAHNRQRFVSQPSAGFLIPGNASNTLVVSLRAAARNVCAEEAAAERARLPRKAAGKDRKGRRKSSACQQAGGA